MKILMVFIFMILIYGLYLCEYERCFVSFLMILGMNCFLLNALSMRFGISMSSHNDWGLFKWVLPSVCRIVWEGWIVRMVQIHGRFSLLKEFFMTMALDRFCRSGINSSQLEATWEKYAIKWSIGLSFESIHIAIQINNKGIPNTFLPLTNCFNKKRFKLILSGSRTENNSSFSLAIHNYTLVRSERISSIFQLIPWKK